jgi:hypothetical protein
LDTWTDRIVVSTGRGKLVVGAEVTAILLVPVYRGNGGSACSYCSAVKSLNKNLSSTLYPIAILYFPFHSPFIIYIHRAENIQSSATHIFI